MPTHFLDTLKLGGLVVTGRHFFPGLAGDQWPLRNECIRVTYAQKDDVVERGLSIIAEEIRKLDAEQR